MSRKEKKDTAAAFAIVASYLREDKSCKMTLTGFQAALEAAVVEFAADMNNLMVRAAALWLACSVMYSNISEFSSWEHWPSQFKTTKLRKAWLWKAIFLAKHGLFFTPHHQENFGKWTGPQKIALNDALASLDEGLPARSQKNQNQ